jgi:hypothetical protein
MGLAEGRLGWVMGFLDETWWSRLARPALNSWSDAGKSLRWSNSRLLKMTPIRRLFPATGFTCRSLRRCGCALWRAVL